MQKLPACFSVGGKFIGYEAGDKGLKRRNRQQATSSLKRGAWVDTILLLKLWGSQIESYLVPWPDLTPSQLSQIVVSTFMSGISTKNLTMRWDHQLHLLPLLLKGSPSHSP